MLNEKEIGPQTGARRATHLRVILECDDEFVDFWLHYCRSRFSSLMINHLFLDRGWISIFGFNFTNVGALWSRDAVVVRDVAADYLGDFPCFHRCVYPVD